MKYVAIMFDVVESRKYYERYDVQKVLMNCVDYLNDIYRYAIRKMWYLVQEMNFKAYF